MELKLRKRFVNGSGTKIEIVSFGEGRILYKVIYKDGVETFYDTLISSFNTVINFNGYSEI